MPYSTRNCCILSSVTVFILSFKIDTLLWKDLWKRIVKFIWNCQNTGWCVKVIVILFEHFLSPPPMWKPVYILFFHFSIILVLLSFLYLLCTQCIDFQLKFVLKFGILCALMYHILICACFEGILCSPVVHFNHEKLWLLLWFDMVLLF